MVNEILVSGGWPKSSKYHGQIGEYVYKMVQNAQHEILFFGIVIVNSVGLDRFVTFISPR